MGRHGQATASRAATVYRRSDTRCEFRHAAPRKGRKGAPPRRPHSPRWARLSLIVGIVLVVISSTAYGAELFLTHRYERNIARADLLGDHRSDAARAGKVEGPLTFLLLGIDKRTEDDYDPNDESSHTWTTPGDGRTDSIIVVHVPEDMNSAYVVSIPRDALVDIPALGDYRGGKDKINAAFEFGGTPLLVATLNDLLGIKIDYPIILNFKAVRELTDAVGGVEVQIDVESYDDRTKRRWTPGRHKLDGNDAEAYVRQRYGLDGGDYDRQKRQQQFIHALSGRIDELGIATNPSKLDKLLRVITRNITVDKSMPVKDLAFALKAMRPSAAKYLGLPMAGNGIENEIWYEYVDETLSRQLGTAIRHGTMPAFLTKNPQVVNDPTQGR